MKPVHANPVEPISARLLAWFEQHGRKSLPWQRKPTPYRVWVSEIMLQQTQVATVIDYYRRFMRRFPNTRRLADAEVDDVLHLWSGLGYYARGRNLHHAARIIRDQHRGRFPRDLEAVRALPGIGRSTAGAILALACAQRHPILDGNVKRVLCRYHAIEGWPGQSRVERALWEFADRHTPANRVSEYTQAIMDLGATVCTRTGPACPHCPLSKDCAAHAQGRTSALPASKPRAKLPVRATRFVILRDHERRVLLEKRPPAGIWGGLWSFPECRPDEDLHDWCERKFGAAPNTVGELPILRHTFSHFYLDILPTLVDVGARRSRVAEAGQTRWYNTASPEACGIAAPIARLLSSLDDLE